MLDVLRTLFACSAARMEPVGTCVAAMGHDDAAVAAAAAAADRPGARCRWMPCPRWWSSSSAAAAAALSATDPLDPNDPSQPHFVTVADPASRWDHQADRDEYRRLVRDLTQRAGIFAPSEIWHPLNMWWPLAPDRQDPASQWVWASDPDDVPRAYRDAMFDAFYKTMAGPLLSAWTGNGLSADVFDVSNAARLAEFKLILPFVDFLGLVPHSSDGLDRWIRTHSAVISDLESVLDVNLLLAHWDPDNDDDDDDDDDDAHANMRPMAVLELGGGYGRLAEALLNVVRRRRTADDAMIRVSTYWLVDAVPASLLYCRQYLATAFPDLRVGFYLDDGAAAAAEADPLHAFDVYVTAAWAYAAMVRRGKLDQLFDVTINVQSMQEMASLHLHAHLGMFNRITKPGGLHYNSNARSWQLTETRWPWPKRWRTVFNVSSLPGRAWRRHFPTLVFVADKTCWTPIAASLGVPAAAACPGPALPPASLAMSIHFIVNGQLHGVLFAPSMREAGLKRAIAEICLKLEGFASSAGKGVYGAQDQCPGALLQMVDGARRHRDRHVAQQLDLSPHSEPFSAAERPAATAAATAPGAADARAYCVEGEGRDNWEADAALREADCLIGWTFASAVVVLDAGVVCVFFCDT